MLSKTWKVHYHMSFFSKFWKKARVYYTPPPPPGFATGATTGCITTDVREQHAHGSELVTVNLQTASEQRAKMTYVHNVKLPLRK